MPLARVESGLQSKASLSEDQTIANAVGIRAPSGRGRLESVDLLRGLLMLLMALDHTRDFFSSAQVNPTNPLESWPSLYVTRWVTHLCAPGFIALAGASVYLQQRRGKSHAQIGRLLLTRGLWLIFLELTLISFGWSFSFAPFLQVIWAIGFCMIMLAGLQWLGVVAVGAIGASIVVGHNLLDPIKAISFGRGADLWEMLHQQGMLTIHGQPVGFLFYPVLPWLGVMCVGYAFGPLAAAAPAFRQKMAAAIGAGFLILFVGLRAIGGYGDSFHWQHYAKPAQTLMSLFQVQKYPPSLDYVLATLGFLLLLYAFFDRAASQDWVPAGRAFIEVYGRVPFFYYVLHLYLIHSAALLLTMARHLDWHVWAGTGFFDGQRPDGWGYSLPVVYAIWFAVILTLYLPCLWFSRLKGTRRDWWLSYL